MLAVCACISAVFRIIAYFGNIGSGQIAAARAALIPDLGFCDSNQRRAIRRIWIGAGINHLHVQLNGRNRLAPAIVCNVGIGNVDGEGIGSRSRPRGNLDGAIVGSRGRAKGKRQRFAADAAIAAIHMDALGVLRLHAQPQRVAAAVGQRAVGIPALVDGIADLHGGLRGRVSGSLRHLDGFRLPVGALHGDRLAAGGRAVVRPGGNRNRASALGNGQPFIPRRRFAFRGIRDGVAAHAADRHLVRSAAAGEGQGGIAQRHIRCAAVYQPEANPSPMRLAGAFFRAVGPYRHLQIFRARQFAGAQPDIFGSAVVDFIDHVHGVTRLIAVIGGFFV